MWSSLPVHDRGENESDFSKTSRSYSNSDEGSWYSWMGNNSSKVITRPVLLIKLSATVEIARICAIPCNSPWPRVAMAHLTCGQCDWGTKILIYLSLIGLNLNRHLWPVATILYGICPKDLRKTNHDIFLLLSVMSYKLSWHIKIICLPLFTQTIHSKL